MLAEEKEKLMVIDALEQHVKPTKPVKHTKYLDIQALRGVAIFAVLLFHISPQSFKQGFLGVDIFFVISGFLMCHILQKQCPLNIEKVVDFYFRRFKRIVPVYTFAISLILLISICFIIHPMDYEQIQRDVWKAMIFCSNVPDTKDGGYFAKDESAQKFFLHLWSLSVEIQFYLIVPCLMFILNLYTNLFKYLMVLIITSISFIFQLKSNGDREHMHLLSRIWQFQIGFLAYYIKESNLLQFTTKNETKNQQILKHSIDTILTIMLISMVSMQILQSRQFNRLLIMLIVLILMSRQSDYWVLCLWPLIELGNVSYSVYMIHWPLIELYKYVLLYENVTVISFGAKTTLLIVSILIGYLMEKTWEKLSKFIDSWKMLFICLAFTYFMIFESMFYLHLNKWDENLLKQATQHVDNPQKIAKNAIAMWKGEFSDELDAKTAISYTLKFNQIFFDLSYCPNPDRGAIPTNFNLSLVGFGNVFNHVVGITTSCVTESNGTKNIVIIGNSHARAAHFGVEYHFKDIYKHMTMFSVGGCNLIRWKGHFPSNDKEHLDGCIRFMDHMYEILEKWKYPIDIIVVAHAYYHTPESEQVPFVDKNTDEYYQYLQTMYSKLGKIAKEVVLFSRLQFSTGISDQTKLVLKKVLNKENLDAFRISYENEHSGSKNTRARLEAVECPNCVPLNWEDIWCNKTLNICDSVDHKRKISYFYDFNHVNTYGSLRVGQYVRKRYDDWLRNKTVVH